MRWAEAREKQAEPPRAREPAGREVTLAAAIFGGSSGVGAPVSPSAAGCCVSFKFTWFCTCLEQVWWAHITFALRWSATTFTRFCMLVVASSAVDSRSSYSLTSAS